MNTMTIITIAVCSVIGAYLIGIGLFVITRKIKEKMKQKKGVKKA